jgi:hypothetical protein
VCYPSRNWLRANLWDSLARGFPICSLVICPELAGSQATRQVSITDDDRVTHHLLDGQQRAQAIRLGFVDPFDGKSDATLWLDLAPGKPGGTRVFRFRIMTKAYPRGYAADDTATRRPVEKIRKSLERCGFDPFDSDFEKRPMPSACWAIESVAPVPVVWLIGAKYDTDDALAANVAKKCAYLSGTKPHGEWIPDVTKASDCLDFARSLSEVEPSNRSRPSRPCGDARGNLSRLPPESAMNACLGYDLVL